MRRPACVLLAAGLALAGIGTARSDLITNGGFETGDFTGFTIAASAVYVISGSAYGEHSGTFHAVLLDNPCCGTLSQTVTTTPGQAYNLTYWLASQGDVATFEADFNGTTIPGSELLSPTSYGAYVKYSFTVTGTGSDTVTFQEFDYTYGLALDDISLNAVVPEPATIALLGTALLGLGVVRRRVAR